MRLGLSGETFPLWFGGIWLVCGLPFLILGIYFGVTQHRDAERLEREGVFANGLVLTKSIEVHRSRHSDSDSAPSYRVRFRFSTPSVSEVVGTAEVTEAAWHDLVERGPIRVRYVPDEPDDYRVDGETNAGLLPYIFAGLGLLFTLVGGIVFSYGVRHVRAVTRLINTGVSAEATVTGIAPARITINGEPQLRIKYQYTDERGRKHTGRSEPMSPDEVADWQPGQHCRIRYDANMPGKSAWLGRAES